MVLVEQISALIDYMASNPELTVGHCSRTNEGRSLVKWHWEKCAQILNSVAVDCPNKTPTEWRLFFNEYKSKIMKKIKLQRRQMTAIGIAPAKRILLTPLQERLYDIMRQQDIGQPLADIRENPDSFYRICDSVGNDTIDEPSISVVEVEEEPEKKISPKSANPGVTDGHQSPKRRRLKAIKRYPVLAAAQDRLEHIENIKAEATLAHAQATNNLAAAIDRLGVTAEQAAKRLATAVQRIGDSISLLVSSSTKKKRRRVSLSSDSEFDE
ncbi:hypothetical protein K1T71_012107 [Dendrolimus kikuchii]|uniref:Uncharacterized protein n=1 Tax=Dendrolimus kikuchii TaxID=765133 RepID=A0ACC1CL21_9NEOP|nr:hypothetical protein K1T71_012107 [Dendrolimus kikuchii]